MEALYVTPINVEEGSLCPSCLEGELHYKVENCTCFVLPPCSACVDALLSCPLCHWLEGTFTEEQVKEIADGVEPDFIDYNYTWIIGRVVERALTFNKNRSGLFTNGDVPFYLLS